MSKVGRNEPCPCGSGKKFKKCHESKESQTQSRVLMVAVGGAILAAIVVGIVSFTSGGGSTPGRVWSPEHGHYHDANGVEIP